MLISTETLSRRDIEHWYRLAWYDSVINIKEITNSAIAEIEKFITATPDAVCSVSWGKDSIVIAHLVRRINPDIPLVWVPTIRKDGTSYEAAETYKVRDTFLGLFPGAYEERPAVARNPKRGDPDYDEKQFSS